MPIIDVQVHAYEANRPERPWLGKLHGPAHVTGDEMIAAMDATGIDGAIIVSPFNLYGFDASYAQAVYAAHPSRFRVVKPVDAADPLVGEIIKAWSAEKEAVGIRILLNLATSTDPADPGLNRALAAAARSNMPVNMLIWGRVDQALALAAKNPDTVMIIDHLGLDQPFDRPAPAQPWANLPKILSFAEYPNVRIKISGACTLSHEPYPFNDIWEPILKIIDAFGIDRCMWGTDWTRATAFLTFEQGVDPFRSTTRLSETDRAKLMGGTVEQVYKWTLSDQ
jgi:L-fuconolactonase